MPGRFIGRVGELEAAREALDAAAAGHGSVLVIAGEAGIGKSRLAQEVVGLARSCGTDAVCAAGWPGGGAPAYWPWPEVLTVVEPDAGTELDLGSSAADAERFDRFRAVTAALRGRAAERPLVVVLDDAHTIDADGLLLTRFVARALVDQPILLVLAHRAALDTPSYTATLLDEIAREGVILRLRGLDPDEVHEFLAANGEEPGVALIRRVRELTDGNPFLVEQVLDAGLHRRDRPVPGAALRLLDAQLDTVDAGTRDLLEWAAVLGPATTVSELSIVAAVDQLAVERARDRAAAAGLVEPDRISPFAFSHDLAREAVLSRLAPDRLAALHRRCLVALDADDSSPERAARRARHALALARCSSTDTADAVAIARSSARVLLEHGAPEAAVELLRDTLAVNEAAGLRATPSLVTELGFALLATGRLADARGLFREAVAGAEETDDAMTYALAALGLGGVWVQEHRSAEERRVYRDILERAVRGIAGDEAPSSARVAAMLRVRDAAERAVIGDGDVAEVRAALDAVRAHGDPGDVAAGLSLLHHVMLGPAYAEERVAVATELLDVARSCGGELQTVMGLLWSAVDALLLGREADQALNELRERADALGMRAILFVADAIDVMRMMRDGDLQTAEKAAVECLDHGIGVGDADASTYYGAHVLALRWYTGETADLLELAQQLAASTAMPAENPVFTAVVAVLAAEAGDADRAERALTLVGRGRLRELLPTSSWLVTMFALVEAASFLKDAELADELYDLLAPYASLPIMASIGVCCFGSTERSLGLAARVSGRLDDAVVHLERAVVENQRLGSRPMTAIARADLAETLLARGRPADRAEAALLIEKAIEAANGMGLAGRLPLWTRVRDSADGARRAPTGTCIRRGEGWEIVAEDERAYVPHTVGMGYLATLLAAPRAEIAAGELAGLDLVSASHDVLDDAALRSLRARITELEDDIDAAVLQGRAAEVESLQRELDGIVSHARAATGLGGQSRRFDDASERARTSVQKAIRRAIENIGRDAPGLAGALRTSVHTGYRCRYDPSRGAPERWDVQSC